MGKMLPPEMKIGKKSFPPMSKCDLSSVSNLSIAADLDGTLLKASLPFLYYVLLAIEAGSLLRGLILMLSLPIIAIVCIFISEDLAGKILIFLAFFGVKVSDLENASRAVLPWFYAMDVRSDSFELFDSCRRKVVVTANPTVMVDAFAQEFLGADKVLGTEIEVDPWTERATGFVKAPGILVGKLKKMAVQKEFGEDMPDIGLGDRKSDHDFMSICKYERKTQSMFVSNIFTNKNFPFNIVAIVRRCLPPAMNYYFGGKGVELLKFFGIPSKTIP